MLKRRHGLVHGGTTDGPASLSNPDGLATGGGLGLLEGFDEERLGILDGVRHGALEVGVRVHGDPVTLVDDGVVGGVHPGGPGVDVADGGTTQGSPLEGVANLLNIRDNGVGAGTNTGIVLGADDRVTVQVLTANADSHNAVGEGVTVLLDGGVESTNLLLDARIAGRTPDAEEERSVLGDSGGNGRDGIRAGARLLDSDQRSERRSTGDIRLTIMVYRRALLKPSVPSRFLAVLNLASKSACWKAAPSEPEEP